MAANLTQDDMSEAKYVAITLEREVFYRWFNVGRAEGLTNHSQIASFLLQRYQKSIDGVQVSVTCVHCHQPLKVKAQNFTRNKHPGTRCTHGQNDGQISISPQDTETVDSGQEGRGYGDNLIAEKSATDGQLQHTATETHCVPGNTKQVAEITNEPTGFGDQRGTGGMSSVSKDVKTEADAVSIESDLHCMASEWSYEFQRQDFHRLDETKIHEPLVHSAPIASIGKQDSRASIVTSGKSCGNQLQLKSSLTVTRTDQRHGSSENALQSAHEKKYLKPFICSYCSSSFQSDDQLQRHMQCHTGQQSYCCRICKASFSGSRFWVDHIQNVHSGHSEFPCLESGASYTSHEKLNARLQSDYCPHQFKCNMSCYVFTTPRDLIEHLEHGKTENTAPNGNQCLFGCSVCGGTFMYASELTAHLSTHVDESYDPCKCQMCSEHFATVDSLCEHILQKHSNETSETSCSHTCGICQASFKTTLRLKIHQNAHTKPHVCKACNAAFADSWQLKCHMRRHSGERPFSCDQCPAKFHTQHILKMHMKRHLGIKPFACEDCGKAFQCRYTLKRHRQVHTDERPYICEVCGKTFKGKSVLNVHRQRHQADKKGPCRQEKFEYPRMCEVCGATFLRKSNFYAHRKRHDHPKKYECSVCNAVLSTSYSYKGHMMRHTGEQPYRCTQCGSAYVVKSRLEIHMKKHHQAASAVSDDSSQKAKDAADTEKEKDCGEQF